MKKRILGVLALVSICLYSMNLNLSKISNESPLLSVENVQAMASGGESGGVVDPNEMQGYKMVRTTKSDGTIKACCEQERPQDKCNKKSEVGCK